jgi:hypothetical protein
MYITNDKIFIHVIKCGGSTFRRLLYSQKPNIVKFGVHHFPIEMVPKRYEKYEKILLIREPISWYKSFYNYTIQLKEKGEKFNFFADLLVYKDYENNLHYRENIRSEEEFLKYALDFQLFVKDFEFSILNIFNKIKRKSLGNADYFTLLFMNYDFNNFVNEFKDVKTIYEFFIKVTGGFEADKVFFTHEDKIFDYFGLRYDNKNYNITKKQTISEFSEKSKKDIITKDKKIIDFFNIPMEN